jgi:hypothetical protein
MIGRTRTGNIPSAVRRCLETGYDYLEARDMIEERIGRKLICECELFRN